MIVRVNVPDTAAPLPLTKTWKLPKLEPVGVSKLVSVVRPVKVINTELPIPTPGKVTALLPLPVQGGAQVKTPDVLNVTGSAFAVEAPIAMKPASATVITIVFINRAMLFISPLNTSFDIAALQSNLVCGKPTDGEQPITLL